MYYLVAHNAQGDVTGLYLAPASGVPTLVGTYRYDAWGKCTITPASPTSDPNNMLNLNPFRYREYYYDQESGFYYLNSRYYDPEVKRFINADDRLNPQTGLTGQNLYAYCNDNPVMYSDPTGHLLGVAIAVIATVAILAAVSTAVANDVIQNSSALKNISGVLSLPSPMLIPALIGISLAQAAKAERTKEAVAELTRKYPDETIIYHWGNYTLTQMTAKPKDAQSGGMSWSTVPDPTQQNVWTTIEKINSSGFLRAVIDNPATGHVSVYPTSPETFGTISEWAATRDTAGINPHIYTIFLYSHSKPLT